MDLSCEMSLLSTRAYRLLMMSSVSTIIRNRSLNSKSSLSRGWWATSIQSAYRCEWWWWWGLFEMCPGKWASGYQPRIMISCSIWTYLVRWVCWAHELIVCWWWALFWRLFEIGLWIVSQAYLVRIAILLLWHPILAFCCNNVSIILPKATLFHTMREFSNDL